MILWYWIAVSGCVFLAKKRPARFENRDKALPVNSEQNQSHNPSMEKPADVYVNPTPHPNPTPSPNPPARQKPDIPVPPSPRIEPVVKHSPPEETEITRAVNAYCTLQWEKTTHILRQALARNRLSGEEKWTTYILLGAMAYQRGFLAEAEQYFQQARSANTGQIPSAELFPPPLVEFYKTLKEK
jgi:hypothetical protein